MESENAASRMELCRVCLALRGPFRDDFNDTDRVQRCACEPRDPPWNAYDYNCHAELCHCCAARVVSSGSKWSLYFCEPCKKRIVAYNRCRGCAVIPIGRHTLMNGLAPRTAAELVDAVLCLGDQASKLLDYHRAHRARILESLRDPPGAVPIAAYLAHARSVRSPHPFADLLRWVTA